MNKHWAHTLIDTDVIRDFMSPAFVKRARISLQKKSDIYKVTSVNNKLLSYNNKMINHKTEEIRL